VRSAFGREALVVGPGFRSGRRSSSRTPAEVRGPIAMRSRLDRAKGGVVSSTSHVAKLAMFVTPKGGTSAAFLAPGLQSAPTRFFTRAAKLPRVEIAKPPKVVGATRCTRCSRASSTGTWGWSTVWSSASRRARVPVRRHRHGGSRRSSPPLSRTITAVDDELTLHRPRIALRPQRGEVSRPRRELSVVSSCAVSLSYADGARKGCGGDERGSSSTAVIVRESGANERREAPVR